MNNLTNIIHKLEEECQSIAKTVFCTMKNEIQDELTEFLLDNEIYKHDFNQSIIAILEKIDEEKILEELSQEANNKILEGYTLTDLAKSLTNYLGGRDE